MPRFPFLATLCGVMLLAVGLLVTVSDIDARGQQERRLHGQAAQASAAFAAHFDRARSLDLLLAQNKVFGGAESAWDPSSADQALDYLEKLFPDAIGEACLIDERGRELARVTAGVPAAPADLSIDEAENEFFAPTLALANGEVYQAAPYVSTDTGTWVISNSTWIGQATGQRLIVHFEVALASFAPYVETDGAQDHLAVVDAATGQILLRDGTARPSPSHEALFPVTAWSTALRARSGEPSGLADVEGRKAAFQQVDRAAGNANHWYVLAWSTSRAGLLPAWAGIGGTAVGLLLIALALLVLRRQQRTLRAAARLDHLTGLANRKALDEALDQSLAEDRRSGERRTAVLMIDLDGFKLVNDSLGHDKGDLVLQEVARRLHANVFEHDLPARLGGDEFAVVLRRLRGSEADLASIAHRLREALIRPFEIDGVLRFVGASIGIAPTTGSADTGAELLRNADAAMYRAKRERDGVRVYEAGTFVAAESMSRAAALLEAIENGDVTLAYQPLFRLDDDRIMGVEALARWDLVGHGPVPPSEFVPLAEETGLIRPLTFLTLRSALDEVLRWRAQGSDVPVSVNLSGRMATERTFPDELAAMLSDRGLPGQALVLEITETVIIFDRPAAVAVLQRVRALGVRIELDDFGSGYASFGALHDLPLDGVKLDRELIADQADGEGRLLAATIETARRLGLTIVAEGIEDGASHELVRRLGCSAAQGYHLARPMSAEAVRGLVCPQPSVTR